ncbi:multidrug effflux MFS transporter [Sagittula stellata]|uniref:Bcr/CflA family efflux transporter n=1 Tax=Sagittula stellata (strain ATCC 700073 / DSM 11524 / E-37) TaxID=388399 RepID=A3K667_SAGS3|nr:multidrug effflux MFS transporter [Sagittula stellata]EBA07217.1 drug resistance transporter, Bcr/CflA subfamily protein [Sagittula stellata E-37]
MTSRTDTTEVPSTPDYVLPGRFEFITMMAMLTAMVAFSIDGMMPALPDIASDLSPDAPNAAQLVLTSFVLGLGVGTLFTGPLSDRFGRKPVIVAGVAVYVLGALTSVLSDSLWWLLLTRLIQGLGAAGPRVVVMAVTRDLYEGRGMAQIMSFVMMVFALVPAMAPLLGQQIIRISEWHMIFLAFAVFGVVAATWVTIRLPETLPKARRRKFHPRQIRAALTEMMALPDVRLPIVVMTLAFACLFSVISSIQPIYEDWLGRAETFPMWFCLTAILAASSSYVNARLVMRLGMRRLITSILVVQIFVSTGMLVVILLNPGGLTLFVAFLVWQQVQFFQAGLTFGNLNAIAMAPMGHIAGTAASVISALATVASVVLAIPIGLLFNGTPLPLVAGVLIYASLALFVMRRLRHIEDA